MLSTTISLRVRYGETDQMGIVYHGSYPAYLEVARIEFFREIGLPYKELEEKGIMLPVVDLYIKYIKPAYYDDLLKIETRIDEIPTGVRFRFDYIVRNAKDEIITQGYSILAFIDKESRRPVRCPKYLTEKLKELAQ